jgi:hypothetical protein
MCLNFNVEFETCGHSTEPVTFKCTFPSNECQHNVTVQAVGYRHFCPLFCPTCLLLPDPRTSSGYRSLNPHPETKENTVFFRIANLEANQIFQRATKLSDSIFPDPLTFVKSSFPAGTVCAGDEVHNIPYLGMDVTKKIEKALATLYASFWWSLEIENIRPSFELRLLHIQLQTYSHFRHFSLFARKYYRDEFPLREGMIHLRSILTSVPLDSLVGEERKCVICAAKLGVPDADGNIEGPVKTCCRHGQHLFGESCLRHWLETKETCPNCRYRLLPIRLTEEEFNLEEEESAVNHEIPGWLVTILGSNPREKKG